jgi:hypothetical protein
VPDDAEQSADVATDAEGQHGLQRHAELPHHGGRIEGSIRHEGDGDEGREHARRPHQSAARRDLRVRFRPFQQDVGVGAGRGRRRSGAPEQGSGRCIGRRSAGQRERFEALAQLELGHQAAHGLLPSVALGEGDALGEKARESAPAVTGVGDADELEQRARPKEVEIAAVRVGGIDELGSVVGQAVPGVATASLGVGVDAPPAQGVVCRLLQPRPPHEGEAKQCQAGGDAGESDGRRAAEQHGEEHDGRRDQGESAQAHPAREARPECLGAGAEAIRSLGVVIGKVGAMPPLVVCPHRRRASTRAAHRRGSPYSFGFCYA